MSVILSQGTTLKIGTTLVGGFTDFSDLGGGQSSEIDTTNLSSVAKEKVLGLRDFGTVKCTFNYNPHDAGQALLKTMANNSTASAMTITYSDGTTEGFSAYVSTFSTAAGTDAVIKLTVNLVITGAVTETVASGS